MSRHPAGCVSANAPRIARTFAAVLGALFASASIAQIQTPIYPEGAVPGVNPNPMPSSPGTPGAGQPPAGVGGYGSPVYPGPQPPTAQPPRPDSPRTTTPPAPGTEGAPGTGVDVRRGNTVGSGAPPSRTGPGSPSAGTGDGRLPPSIYSRDNRLPSSPGSGVGVGSGSEAGRGVGSGAGVGVGPGR